MELSFSTWIRVEREMGAEREKIELYCESVSEYVGVCVCVYAGSLHDTDSHEMPGASN